jgi:hypothetical protein
MAYSFWSGAGLVVTAALIVSGLRRHGWARFARIAVAVVVLLLTFWFDLVRVLDTGQLQSREQATAASQQAAVGKALQNLQNAAAPGSGTVRWHGRVVIPASGGLELDPMPPKPGNGANSDITIGPSGQDQISGSVISPVVNTAQWTGPAFPSQGQCSTQIASDPQLQIAVRPGAVVCVRTAAGRIAALRFISVTGDHGSDVAEATVWQ